MAGREPDLVLRQSIALRHWKPLRRSSRKKYRYLYSNLNPFATLFTAYRDVVIYGHRPDLWMLGYVALLGSVILAAAMLLIRRLHGVLPMHV